MEKFIRVCPVCDKEITHTNKCTRDRCLREKRLCKSCGAKKRIEKYGYGKNFEAYTIKGKYSGKNNPFYGKKHTKETIEKMKNSDKDKSFFLTQEYKDKISKTSKGCNVAYMIFGC